MLFRRFVLAFVTIVVAAVCLACSTASDGHDGHAADQAALETITSGMRTMFSWRPGVDTGRADAFRRAAPWLTEQLAATASVGTERGPGAQWDGWARARATVEAKVLVVGAEHGVDTADRIDRLVMITQDVKSPEGTVVETVELTAKVVVDRVGDAWRISAIEFA